MFRIIELGDAQWPASIVGLGADRRDIHFDQRFLATYVAAYNWKASLFFTDTLNGYVVQPILRTTENEIRNPYNFGGPIGSHDLVNGKQHIDSVNEWAEKHDIKKQYFTLVPNLAQQQLKLLSSAGVCPEFKKQSVIIDLQNQKIRGTTRRLATKAQNAGVTVKSYPSDQLKYFIEIYEATMDRNDAKDHWRFSSKWFECFTRFVKPCLILAEYKGMFEAGCLIAYSQQYPVAYYHFAGSYNQYPDLGINHQMVLAACEFVKSVGIRYLCLGGGITDSVKDGLFTFKSGFSQLRQPVYTYQTSVKMNEVKPLERTAGGIYLN